MMVDRETFVSVSRKTYKWPFAKPLTAKPAAPPYTTKPKGFFKVVNVEPYCHCDGDLYGPYMDRYQKLTQKEELLHEEIIQLKREMETLGNEMKDKACKSFDDSIQSTYMTDFVPRTIHVAQYTKLMPSVDSPNGLPVKSPTAGLKYKDPTKFQYSAFPIPATGRGSTKAKGYTGQIFCSEYGDSYSNNGLKNIKDRQQYAYPLPASPFYGYAARCL